MKNKMKKLIAFVLVLCIVGAFAACGTSGEDTKESAKKKIVAVSIVPEQTFVKAVCGDLVDVVTMVPSGSNPENYEPTAQQMQQFSDASVYFTIGVPTEKANILPNVGKVPVVSLQDAVEAVYAPRTFEDGSRDPHIWLSPKRVKVIIDTIRDQMIKLDPSNEDTYTKNAASYSNQLTDVDTQIKTALTGVKNKSFIVFHPAFGYLADDYGLTMYALEEEGNEATAAHLQDMIDFAKKNNIKVIFYQSEIDSSQSKAFAEEIGGKTMELAPLSPDYINNMKAMAKTMAEVMK